MRITTWNVNGLRAALRKRFTAHRRALKPDILLLQEIRVTPGQLPKNVVKPRGWRTAWHPAERLGYAGVAVWSRSDIEVLGTGLDGPDPEGRVLRVRTGGMQVVSVYLPSGSMGPDKQAKKEQWMADFLPWAERLARTDEPVVIGGDLNIAHTERDIHNASGNKNNTGFLPHERAWFGDLLDAGWTDLCRTSFGEVQGPYSWWSNRGQARKLDRGWRIDYLLGNPVAAALLSDAHILRKGGLDTSDHAPVSVDLSR